MKWDSYLQKAMIYTNTCKIIHIVQLYIIGFFKIINLTFQILFEKVRNLCCTVDNNVSFLIKGWLHLAPGFGPFSALLLRLFLNLISLLFFFFKSDTISSFYVFLFTTFEKRRFCAYLPWSNIRLIFVCMRGGASAVIH